MMENQTSGIANRKKPADRSYSPQVGSELIQHLAPWRQNLLSLLQQAKSAPDRPPQESDDGDHAEPERNRSGALKNKQAAIKTR